MTAQSDYQALQEMDVIRFWNVHYNIDKDGEIRGIKGVNIIYPKLIEVLLEAGFRRFDIDDAQVFVRIHNFRVLRRVTPTLIADFMFDYVDSLPDWLDADKVFHRNDLKQKVFMGYSTYFDEKKLTQLRPDQPIIFQKDTLTQKFVYYDNGYVEITKDGAELKSYDTLEHFIWESEQLHRNYKKVSFKNGDAYRFFSFISSTPKGHKFEPNAQRQKQLEIIAGYYMHDYTDYKLKLLLNTDSSLSENDEAEGRTGKGIFSNMLGYMLANNPKDETIRTYCEINGKDFDPREKTKYTGAGIDTKLVVINDVRKNFDIDALYNDITEGIMVKKLFQQPFIKRVKIIVNTNKEVKITGASSRDRVCEFEFSNYFSDTYSPEDEFKRWLFRDWDQKHWAEFDSYMIHCILQYFKSGQKLPSVQQINLNARKLRAHTNVSFIEFMDEVVNPIHGHEYNKAELFEQFQKAYPDFAGDKFKRATFGTWLKHYCNLKDQWANYKKDDKNFSHETRPAGKRNIVFVSAKSQNPMP